MFKQLTIRARLIALVVFMLVLIGGLGLEGLNEAQKAEQELERLYARRMVPVGDIKRIADGYAVTIVDGVHKYNTGALTALRVLSALDAAERQKAVLWPQFTAHVEAPEEVRVTHEAEQLMKVADQSVADLKAMLQKDDRAAVAAYARDRLYKDMDPVSSKLTELVDLQIRIAKDEHDEQVNEYRAARRLTLNVIFVGIIGAIAIGMTVIRTISRSVSRVNDQLRELAAGDADLTKRIPVERGDEMGQLATHFNAMMDKLLTLVRRVQESGIQVTSSSTELAASSKELEATMAEQVASTNEVVSSAKEISATSQQLVSTMGEVSGLVELTEASAGEGQTGLERMGRTMRDMEDASRAISEQLAAINAKAGSITNVVTTINKVADQTNLLSLNAAIEAAKAGEVGQGFAVVAREIRRLADQTAGATTDIEQTVKEMQSAVASGVMGMEKFAEQVRHTVQEVARISSQLADIIDQVRRLGPRFESVTQGMESQSVGARQISSSMVQLSDATRHTASTLEDSRRAIDQLNQAARSLQREVGRFRVTMPDDLQAHKEELMREMANV